jgi:hypothetical protein
MIWTKDAPKEPGWYWYRHGKTTVVYFDGKHIHGLPGNDDTIGKHVRWCQIPEPMTPEEYEGWAWEATTYEGMENAP